MTAKIPKKYRGESRYDEYKDIYRQEYCVPVGDYPEGYVFEVPTFCITEGQRYDEVEISEKYPVQLHFKNPEAGTKHKRYKLTEAEVQELYRAEMKTIEKRYQGGIDKLLDSHGWLYECKYAAYRYHRMSAEYDWVWESAADAKWVYPLSLNIEEWNQIKGKHRIKAKAFEVISEKFEVPCIRTMLQSRKQLLRLTDLYTNAYALNYDIPAKLGIDQSTDPAATATKEILTDATDKIMSVIGSQIVMCIRGEQAESVE